MSLFGPPTIEKLTQRALLEAQTLLMEHAKLAEYHNAMASMLQQRIDRLTTSQSTVRNSESPQ